jgi:hypothetical protein
MKIMKRFCLVVGTTTVGLLAAALPLRAQRTPMLVRDFPMAGGNYFLRVPEFVEAAKATFLRDDDHVVGVTGDGVAKAYPAVAVTWHHAVEDRIGELPIFVTW